MYLNAGTGERGPRRSRADLAIQLEADAKARRCAADRRSNHNAEYVFARLQILPVASRQHYVQLSRNQHNFNFV
jgi:hypothetical protein